jgi:hypothetical protein
VALAGFGLDSLIETRLGSGRITTVAASAGPHLSFSDAPPFNWPRWGDYSFAQPDPDGYGVWLATEYIPPAADQDPHPGRTHVTAACREGGWKLGRRSQSPVAFEPFNGASKPAAASADLGLPKTRLER